MVAGLCVFSLCFLSVFSLSVFSVWVFSLCVLFVCVFCLCVFSCGGGVVDGCWSLCFLCVFSVHHRPSPREPQLLKNASSKWCMRSLR